MWGFGPSSLGAEPSACPALVGPEEEEEEEDFCGLPAPSTLGGVGCFLSDPELEVEVVRVLVGVLLPELTDVAGEGVVVVGAGAFAVVVADVVVFDAEAFAVVGVDVVVFGAGALVVEGRARPFVLRAGAVADADSGSLAMTVNTTDAASVATTGSFGCLSAVDYSFRGAYPNGWSYDTPPVDVTGTLAHPTRMRPAMAGRLQPGMVTTHRTTRDLGDVISTEQVDVADPGCDGRARRAAFDRRGRAPPARGAIGLHRAIHAQESQGGRGGRRL